MVPHLRLGVMGATTWLSIIIGVAINLSLKSGHSWLGGALDPEIFNKITKGLVPTGQEQNGNNIHQQERGEQGTR